MMSLKNCLAILGFIAFCPFVIAQSQNAPTLFLYCEDDKPLQYFDKNKKLVGLTVEIIQEIQRRTGNSDPIQVVPWSRGMYMLKNNANTLLFTMARTAEREHLYQWIGPIISMEYGLYVKANSNIKINNIEDAKNIGLIGVLRDDIRDQTLTRLGFTNLDRSSLDTISFKKLMINRIEAYVDTKSSVGITAVNAGHLISDVKLAIDLFKSDLYISASKNTDTQMILKWNQVLMEMKKDKTYLNILRKYNREEFAR